MVSHPDVVANPIIKAAQVKNVISEESLSIVREKDEALKVVLNERAARLWAATEANAIGHGACGLPAGPPASRKAPSASAKGNCTKGSTRPEKH